MVLKKKFCLFLITGFFLASFAVALEVPQLNGRVNDYASIIDDDTKTEIESYLEALESQTGIQLAVLTIPSLEGDDIASFALRVCEKWQLGQKDKDNGGLLLAALEEHSLRIEVGYGLEESLTDAKCGLIIRNVIVPEFKNGNYSQGILNGIKNMGGIASGNVELVNKSVLEENDSVTNDAVGLAFMIVWFLFFFVVAGSKGGLWKWLFFSKLAGGSSSLSNYSSGSYKSSSSSHFNSFGSGSSGFHGGGGHFGGGGASGHW